MNKILTIMFAALLASQAGVVSAQTTQGPAPDATTQSQQPVADTASDSAASAESDKAQATDEAHEPIRGAFGIPLGEKFEASMVAKVIERQAQNYYGPGGQKRTGSLLKVEPSQPDKRFQHYSVQTTEQGVVYAIRGEYQLARKQLDDKQAQARQAKEMRSTCKTAVIDLAKELEGRYGEPRGKNMTAEWIAFRQHSETSNRGVKVLGNRCRSGIYSVVYTDDAVNATPKDKQQAKDQPASES